jgi:hypothetical protein
MTKNLRVFTVALVMVTATVGLRHLVIASAPANTHALHLNGLFAPKPQKRTALRNGTDGPVPVPSDGFTFTANGTDGPVPVPSDGFNVVMNGTDGPVPVPSDGLTNGTDGPVPVPSDGVTLTANGTDGPVPVPSGGLTQDEYNRQTQTLMS